MGKINFLGAILLSVLFLSLVSCDFRNPLNDPAYEGYLMYIDQMAYKKGCTSNEIDSIVDSNEGVYLVETGLYYYVIVIDGREHYFVS